MSPRQPASRQPASRQPAPSAPEIGAARGASVSLRVAAGLVAAQGLTLVAVAVRYPFTTGDSGSVASAWALAAVGIALGAAITALLARSLARGARGAIAPTLLLELIGLGTSYNLTQESLWAYAAALAVAALTVVALVLTAAARQPADPDR